MERIAACALGILFSSLAVAEVPSSPPELTAAQIVEKNVQARGGLEAWRKIKTMVWVGHIESASPPGPNLPFVLEQKRPNLTRFEMRGPNEMAIHVFDGTKGWKMQPMASGRPSVQPYTKEELSYARDGQGIDGPLVDYQVKGITVALDGMDKVEGRSAYRLSVKLPSGVSHHVWIDAQNFLDLKYDRESRNAAGQTGTVSVYYRDYKTIDGVQIPQVMESGTDAAKGRDRMVIDRIVLNAALPDRLFARPLTSSGSRHAVTIDAEPGAATAPTPRTSPHGARSPSQPASRGGGAP